MLESSKAKAGVAQDGSRLDLAAVELFPALSRKKIKTIIDTGGAYVNKKRILFAKHIVKQGDQIELFWKKEAEVTVGEGQRDKFKRGSSLFEFTAQNIIHENVDFLVVNKPAGLASQATLESDKNTVIYAIHNIDAKKYPLAELMLVHRLDKETSGLLLVARNAKKRVELETLFRDRKVEKKYEALTFYIPKESEGDIELAIVKDNSRPNAYYASKSGKSRDAKSAFTHYKVTETFRVANASRIECKPRTGRTHQIRVHLSAIGCPIIGDKTYSQGVVGHGFAQMAVRHMLHAKTLRFCLDDKEWMEFEAPYPSDFESCLTQLRAT